MKSSRKRHRAKRLWPTATVHPANDSAPVLFHENSAVNKKKARRVSRRAVCFWRPEVYDVGASVG